MFSTKNTSDTLFARVNAGGVVTDVSLGAPPTGYHVYRVQPIPGAFQFYIDGTLQTTVTGVVPSSVPLKIAMSTYLTTGPSLQVDWVRTEGGTFTSSVLDAGRNVNWGAINWTAILPAGTSIVIETRTGNTAVPDGSWSDWSTVSNGGTISSPSSRYLQYRVRFITFDPTLTAVLQQIMVQWS
jgi:hypothetical protein